MGNLRNSLATRLAIKTTWVVTETQRVFRAFSPTRWSRVGPMTESEISSEGSPTTQPPPESPPVPDPTAGPSVAPDHLGGPLVVLQRCRQVLR